MAQDVWTLIGAGMGGKGLAAQLGIDGLRLRIHDIDDAQVAGIRAAGGLHVEGRDATFAPIEMATTDLAAAVKGASVLLVSIYGNDHPALAGQLAPLLEDGQTIVLIQGHFAGALVFRTALDRAGCTARVDVAEMDGYPYMLTVKSPDTVLMTSIKKTWQVAAMPASRTQAVLDRIGSAFPGMVAAPSLLHTAFLDLGALFHVGGIVTNVGNVEREGTYNFYESNMTPSVCNFIAAMDAERVAVAKAFGIAIPDVMSWLGDTYGYRDMTLHEGLQTMAHTHYRYAPAPKSLSHRYLVQDVTCGMVPIAAFAAAAGIESLANDTAINLGNLLTKRDFRREGRTLENLGIAGKSVGEIIAFVSA
jgi:opine dehydrogenase